MSHFVTGIVGTSRQENERRVPVHPGHLSDTPHNIRHNIIFECGYGALFGVEDREIEHLGFGMEYRDALFERCDLLVLPRPVRDDFDMMKPGAAITGWGLFALEEEFTQVFIDKRMTMIDFAAMFEWDGQGNRGRHLFKRNNELAGYAGVMHALSTRGMCGAFGRKLSALVIAYGSVGRGAVIALLSAGISDITVLVSREPSSIAAKPSSVSFLRYARRGGTLTVIDGKQNERNVSALIADADVIVNAIRQDTDNPVMYIPDGGEDELKPGSLLIDVSCDRGMGFPFARPTTFDDAVFRVGPAYYYGINHTPTYFWNSASWEISRALCPLLPSLAAGPDGWENNEIIRRAVDIRDGIVINPRILSYQNRSIDYPHRRKA